MKNPNPLMLVRIAQGDAYGVCCEYIKFPRDQEVFDRALKFESYGRHPTHKLEPGQYTDDTQMSIAVTEVLLKDEPPTPEIFADAFVRTFKRDQRDGYARNFQAFLEKVSDGTEFLKEIKPDSDKNGAAMRAVPIGVLPCVDDVIRIATMQAKLTHDTRGGIDAAVAVALMSHYSLYSEEPLSKLPDWLDARGFVLRWVPGQPVEGPDVGMKTASAVALLVATSTSLIDLARHAIRWGGDTDSVLAIAWGIASARMREPLPDFFDRGLENGTYGRNFLADAGRWLMEKYEQPQI